ncbi:nucleotidyl transferase AbiEii/AbiGii toxin family protein [soil metagenome]
MAKKPSTRGVVDAAALAASQLAELDARFAVIGGLAVGARGEPRYTRDVDLAIGVANDEEAERLLFAMTRRGYSVVTVIEQTRTGRLSTARLRHPRDPEVFVDLLFASSGIEKEVVEGSERLAYRPGTELPVARVGHLIALKVLSESDERLQDRIDLKVLGAVATDEDWATADAAVRLIKTRRYHRGRALLTRLRRWRAASARPA